MLKSCSRCGRIHGRGQCAIKAKSRSNDPASEIRRFRSSGAWRKCAERVRERDGNLCQACLHEEPAAYTVQGLSIHHVVPIESDFDKRLDEANLITLCEGHHRMAEVGMIDRKTLEDWIRQSAERARRAK